MSRFLASTCAGSLLLVLLFVPLSTHAQVWRQEMQVLTTVEYGEPIHAFLDSLSARLATNPSFQTRRSADDKNTMAYSDLLTALYDEGIDLQSASHVFLRYRFTLGNQGDGLTETLEDLYFIFRFDDATADIPIIHLDTRDPLVHALLVHRGVSSPMNMEAVRSFRELMAFPLVQGSDQTVIVEIGRQPLREEIGPKHRVLIDYLNGQEPSGYTLETLYQQAPFLTTESPLEEASSMQ